MLKLDQLIDEVIKDEDLMVQSQQQNGYCVAGLLADKIKERRFVYVSDRELLFILHEKFKDVVKPNSSFTFTRDELEQFLDEDQCEIIDSDIYEHLLKGYQNSEYTCQVCRNPHSG